MDLILINSSKKNCRYCDTSTLNTKNSLLIRKPTIGFPTIKISTIQRSNSEIKIGIFMEEIKFPSSQNQGEKLRPYLWILSISHAPAQTPQLLFKDQWINSMFSRTSLIIITVQYSRRSRLFETLTILISII